MNKLFTLFAALCILLFTNVSFSQVDVSTGGPVTSYTTLKDAFDAINLGTHTSAILIEITGNTTETATALLNASGIGAASYTSMIIRPSGGAGRTITGAIVAGSPLIDLNGADNVTIDGLNTGGNSLTISNTTISATSGTCTIRFIGGATNNVITNSNLQGSVTMALGTNGGVVFFSTDALTPNGNDNNTISNCNIGPAGANLPTKCIYANGSQTGALRNSGNIINNNNIFDFFNATISVSGIHILSGNDLWTVSNNRIYQTAARTFTGAGLRYAGITINSTAGTIGSFTVTGNTIGFGSSAGTGTTTISGSTNTFRGIDVPSVSTSTATSIQGNTISGIIQNTASTGTGTGTGFVAMMLGTSTGLFNIGTITGNNIGSLDGSSTIVVNSSAGTGTVNGIYDFSVSNNNISNNNIGSITIQGTGTTNGFRGILVNTGTANSCVISNNTIANITDTQVGSYAMYCIQVSLPSATITGNTMRNITGNSNGAVVVMSGIAMISNTAVGISTISQNTIHTLNNTVTGGGAGAIYAMDLQINATANVVERNFVHSCNVTTSFTTYQLWAIVMRGVGSATFKNNLVRLGIRADGSSITTGYSVVGFRDIAGATTSYYNNSVYIGGTGVVSSSNTYCFFSDVVTNTRNYQNNIFWNARSNGTGTIANVSIRVGGTTANPPGLTTNFNLLRADGNSGATGVFNGFIYTTISDWRTITGQDAKSFTNNPAFINPTGNATSLDLHIQPSSLGVNGRGTYVASVTNDYDNDSRPTSQSSSVSPVDVGADQYTPSSPSGNVTTISGLFLMDGDLRAIELVDGDILISEVRQYPGVQTPNNSLRPGINNTKSVTVNEQKIINETPVDQKLQTNSVNGSKEKTSMELNVNAVEVINETFTSDIKQVTPAPNNHMRHKLKANPENNKINKENDLNGSNRKKGTSGGQTEVSAVTSPWLYWEIDDYENIGGTDVILRFYYNDEQLAAIPEANLKLSYWDGTAWDNAFSQTVNTTNNYIEVTIPAFLTGPANMLFAMEDVNFPLPVVISEFNAIASSRDANLKWVTSSEINNKGFSVERRIKLSGGKDAFTQWKEVAFINGNGTTNEPKTYIYSDKKLNSGIYQYRLKQIDYNSNFEYFSPEQNDVAIGKPGTFDVSQNYPNPSNPVSKIDFQMPFDGKVSIKVYDILGQEVKTLVDEFKSADFYTVQFDGSNLASGTYFYRIIADDSGEKFSKTLKMILVK